MAAFRITLQATSFGNTGLQAGVSSYLQTTLKPYRPPLGWVCPVFAYQMQGSLEKPC